MYKKIAHLADIHISKDRDRHDEYKQIIEKTRVSLQRSKPDLIVLVGDLNHDYLKLETEHMVLQGEFLKMLSSIAPVRITRGNHDVNINHPERLDAIGALVNILGDDNIRYYNETGFYEDGNITWAVWHHRAENENPWTLDHIKNDNQIYIDLFHDPVNGARNNEGFEFERANYRNISDFKGDYSFFGDIHKYQTFADNTKAYCGSLFQQNFGESVDEHGYLMWDLETGEHELIEVHNDYSYRTVFLDDISELEDYDNSDFGTHPRVRVFYYVTSEDTKKGSIKYQIRKYFKEKHDAVEVNPLERTFNSNVSYAEFSELNEDIERGKFNTDIATEVLGEMGYDETFINEFLELDTTIEERLVANTDHEFGLNNIDILKIEINNFKSYGEDIVIDWEELNGITSLTAPNRTGKSTIMDAILFNLFGKTLQGGKKKEQMFNYNTDAKEVSVTGYYDINGEKFAVKRYITRKKKKGGGYSYGKTNIDYFKIDDDNNIVDKLNEERVKMVSKKIETQFGSYDEFIRNNIITSGLILEYLSSKKSDFVDALLKDTGLYVYDLKLKEIKNFKKEYIKSEGVIKINETEENEKIEYHQQTIDDNIKEIERLNKLISELDTRINKGEFTIKTKYEELIKIDDELLNLDISAVKTEIQNLGSKKTRILSQIEDIKSELNKYQGVRERVVIMNELNDLTQQINTLNQNLNEKTNKQNIIKNDISSLSKDIERLKQDKDNAKNSSIQQKEHLDTTHTQQKNELAINKERIAELNQKLEEYEKKDYCPHCGEKLNIHSEDEINNIIADVQTKINELVSRNNNIEHELSIYDNKVQDIKKNYKNDIKQIDTKISDIIKSQEHYKVELDQLSDDIKSLNIKLNEIAPQKNNVETELSQRENYDAHNNKLQEFTNELKTIDLNVRELELKTQNYDSNKENIEHNIRVKSEIEKYEQGVNTLKNEQETHKSGVIEYKSLNKSLKEKIGEIKRTIELYNKQQRKIKLFEEYEKIVHRDGLPSMLLKQILPKINANLNNMVSEISMDLYLNDEFEYMMKNYHSNEEQSAIEGSGAEKTFAVMALKFALREVNKNVKYNLIFMDECFSAFDSENKSNIKMKMMDMAKMGYNVVIISHDEDINEIANNIIRPVMNDEGVTTLI